MKQDETKMMLADSAMAEAVKAHAASAEAFLDPDKVLTNIVGLGVGVKWRNGEPTGEPALLALVRQKLEKDQLTKSDLVPKQLSGMQTDVVAIGEPVAGGEASEADGQTLKERVRPAQGGYSVGHPKVTAGTIATCVYDILPEGKVSPPTHGIGIPRAFYILSNNHVLAAVNDAHVGDPILQPGAVDGGTLPADQIGRLSRFIPITLYPPVPLLFHKNLVDAAIAEGRFHELNREIYWIGYVRGWRRSDNVKPGMIVQKTGRTTNYTVGRVMAVKAVVDVGYGSQKGRFIDQIVTTCMSAPGDSGSLVTTLDNVAVGLLFAGSYKATIANQIEHVRSLLGVEVAEEIM